MNEKNYLAGQQSVWHRMLCDALGNLGAEGFQREQLVAERVDTVRVLRDLCEVYGDNDWPDNLYLADAIEKHLGRHLTARGPGP